MSAAGTGAAQRWGSWLSTGASVVALILPKCPLCFVGYAAALAACGIDISLAWNAARGFVVASTLVSFAIVTALSLKRRDALVATLAVVGGVVVITAVLSKAGREPHALGAGALAGAGWLNAWRCRRQLPKLANEFTKT